jgi:tartronate-semialdehyde synthase
MPKMPSMQAVVHILESEGIDTVFGVPGAAILPLYAALEHSNIRHLTVRHEEGGTHAADGWARVTGNVGVCLGTSGPAGTNMITGLYTAQADSIPILCVTGQAARAKLHQEAFQAVDIVEIAKPVTKWAVQIKEAAQVPWIFREALRLSRSGRPGPVLIDIPIDVARQEIEYDPDVDAPLPVPEVPPSPAAVRKALDMLLEAERPLLLAGGGVVIGDASAELVRAAEHLNVPVQITLMGKGAFPEDHALFAGMAGLQTQQRYGNAAFLESDFVLALGARFGDRHTGDLETYRQGRRFVHVDIEPTQIGRVFAPDLGVVSGTRPFLRALLAEAQARGAGHGAQEWPARVRELKATLRRRDDFDTTPIKPPRVFREINQTYGPDTYFVTAIGLYQIWSGQFQDVFKPRHYLCCGQAGPLGWEVSAATGVKCAIPDADVVAVVGDYSFQFMVEEVAVAAQYQTPFVIVLLNNQYLGLIRQAELPYHMNYAVDIHYGENGVDHVKLMEAFGCPARRVTEPGDIADALKWANAEAARARVPVLVEVMIEREANAAMGPSISHIVEYEESPDDQEAEYGAEGEASAEG